MADFVNNLITNTQHQAARGGAAAASSAAKHTLRWFGVPVTSALVAGMDIWDFELKKHNLTAQYADEVAAKLGIKPAQVKTKDFAQAAKENPALDQALKRLKRERNLNLVTNVATALATFALAITVLHGIVPLIAVGIGGFIASKLVADVIGKRVLGLHEPSFKKVDKNPPIQQKLSLPGQITYLQNQQNTGKKILPYQVEYVFAKAGNTVAPEKAKEIANKLNQRNIDATELAFMVYDQKSGKPEIVDRELTRKDQIIQGLQERVATTEQKLSDATNVAKEKAGIVVDSAKDKAGDIVANAKDKASEMSTKWREKHPSRAGQSAADAVQQSREAPNTGVSL